MAGGTFRRMALAAGCALPCASGCGDGSGTPPAPSDDAAAWVAVDQGVGALDVGLFVDAGSPADAGGTLTDGPAEASAGMDASVPPRDVPMAADRPALTDAGNMHDAGAPVDVTHPAPPFGSIPWADVGTGVVFRDSQNPAGHDVFIGYAGYAVQLPWAETWVSALYESTLRAHGVRYVYAVQGPRDPTYTAQEIGNSHLIGHMIPRLSSGARILVGAHSSGGFVASELLGQLYARGLDPTHATAGRLTYWDLDGASAGLDAAIVGQLHHAYFVWAQDGATRSPNADTMLAAGASYPHAGGAVRMDAAGAGCNAGATWCVHVALITQRPHDPAGANAALDYGSIDGAHPVTTAWLADTGYGLP